MCMSKANSTRYMTDPNSNQVTTWMIMRVVACRVRFSMEISHSLQTISGTFCYYCKETSPMSSWLSWRFENISSNGKASPYVSEWKHEAAHGCISGQGDAPNLRFLTSRFPHILGIPNTFVDCQFAISQPVTTFKTWERRQRTFCQIVPQPPK